MNIIKINPRECNRWKFADRGNFELGDIHALAQQIKKDGQIEPVHVRELKDDKNFKYEVIAGTRRWKACLDENLPLLAIINNVSDEEALVIQSSENKKHPISEYSIGLIYSKVKQDLNLTQQQLADLYHTSHRQIRTLLCFAKIDEDIINAINNMKHVSARSAEAICQIANKSPAYKSAIIEIAEDIRKGAGAKSIKKLTDNIVLGKDSKNSNDDIVQSKEGYIFAEWKSNKLHIPKDIEFDKNRFNKHILKFFEKS